MDLRPRAEDRAFRDEVRTFLEESLAGDFAVVRGRGGPGDEHALFDERLAWERHLGAHGWTCVGWPKEHGGRGLPLRQQVIYFEEYARAKGPGRLGHIGEGLVGPTLIAFGSPEQRRRFLPRIAAGEELWCQGYSEPNAGSDLANVQTRAELDTGGDADSGSGDDTDTAIWRITGQKVWTSLAQWADWCFVLARTTPLSPGTPKHRGLSYLLVPMKQDGVEIRPIVQVTGDSEFNEVFFDGARTAAGNVVGEMGDGWRVAMGTLGFERGASTLGQQLSFRNELDALVDAARRNGRIHDAVIRQRLAQAHIELKIMRLHALRTLDSTTDDGTLGREALIGKLYWSTLHRSLGELAVDVLGPDALVFASPTEPDDDDVGDGPSGEGDTGARPAATDPSTADAPGPAGELAHAAGGSPTGYDPTPAQRLFLFTRADTIYGGSNQIQRNIIGERALGLPKEPRPKEAT